ncbi:MAG: hypothetical protein WC479_09355 [Candidatus Izemoplasmatales bacterium]
MPEFEEEVIINVSSLFGARTKRPLVQLSIGEHDILLPPAKAQEIGMKLIHGAESANMDAFFMQFLTNVIGAPTEKAATLMADYRQFREETRFEMRFLVDDQGEPKPEL